MPSREATTKGNAVGNNSERCPVCMKPLVEKQFYCPHCNIEIDYLLYSKKKPTEAEINELKKANTNKWYAYIWPTVVYGIVWLFLYHFILLKHLTHFRH